MIQSTNEIAQMLPIYRKFALNSFSSANSQGLFNDQPVLEIKLNNSIRMSCQETYLKNIATQLDHIKQLDTYLAGYSPVKLLSQVVDINAKLMTELSELMDIRRQQEFEMKRVKIIEHVELNKKFISKLETYKNSSKVKRFLFKFSFYKMLNSTKDALFKSYSSIILTDDKDIATSIKEFESEKEIQPIRRMSTQIDYNKSKVSDPLVRIKRRSSSFSEVSCNFLEKCKLEGVNKMLNNNNSKSNSDLVPNTDLIPNNKNQLNPLKLDDNLLKPTRYIGNIDVGDFGLNVMKDKACLYRSTSNAHSAFSPPGDIYSTTYTINRSK
ncbi:hypothetical protein K502DRAFT_361824 [Neoconidiobolus thromboides FSU 785]|nr:hypothetical protein K502DRAFT_361824 [Neoconidiobolus thromboides FSU 785]